MANRLTPHLIPHFFKYVTYEGALSILKDVAIKWSSPLTFNDPFDILVKPNIGFSEDEFKQYNEKKFLEDIYSDKPPNHDREMIEKIRAQAQYFARNDLASMLQPRLNQCLKEISSAFSDYQNQWLEFAKNIRVLCLTEVHDNLLMWAHYAEDHKGAVIQLKCIPHLDTPTCSAIRVQYQDVFPRVATIEEWTNELLNIEPLERNEIFLRFMATKSTHWAYEKEWRCLDQKRPTDNGDHEICAINSQEIEAIYLGCRMPDDHKKEIDGCLSGALSHVKIYTARQHSEKYQLEFSLMQKR